MRKIEVHGHRGARALRPENTLAAFEYAIALGVDAIELDVVVTRDHVLVVSHDPVLEAPLCLGPTGAGDRAVIREITFGELRRWDCGSVRNSEFPRQVTVPGARIPSLDQVFRLALRTRHAFRFNVEIKSFPDQPELAPSPPEFAQLVVASIQRHGVEGRVIVQSFDFRMLHAIRKLAPEIPRAALFEDDALFGGNLAEIAQEAGAAIVAPLHTLVTEPKVQQCHDAGLSVIPWTANTEADWERLARAGVDGIITDDPAGLIDYLNRIFGG